MMDVCSIAFITFFLMAVASKISQNIEDKLYYDMLFGSDNTAEDKKKYKKKSNIVQAVYIFVMLNILVCSIYLIIGTLS